MSMATEVNSLQVGAALPGRRHTPDNAELFFYNAALWNAHRIHYDLPYATTEEGYEGLVIAGPMIGDWMTQVVDDWLQNQPEADNLMLAELDYSNRVAAFIGETLDTGGTVTGISSPSEQTPAGPIHITIDLFVKNEREEIITPGKAVVLWSQGSRGQ